MSREVYYTPSRSQYHTERNKITENKTTGITIRYIQIPFGVCVWTHLIIQKNTILTGHIHPKNNKITNIHKCTAMVIMVITIMIFKTLIY